MVLRRLMVLSLLVFTGCEDAAEKKASPTCGDEVVDVGEGCDQGDSNSDTIANACRTTCVVAACGDGVPDTGESCDDGDLDNNDGCLDTCKCSTGYEENSGNCVDVDECSVGSDNCDSNATCSNTEGSFACACKSGYTGNGTTCTRSNVVECELGSAAENPVAIEISQQTTVNVFNCGSAISASEITPHLPAGLTLTAAGVLQGTPTARTSWTSYTFKLTTAGGITTLNVNLAVHDLDADWLEITNGAATIDYGGSTPSLIVPVGKWAFPVAMHAGTKPFISASHAGRGRVIGFGHEGPVASNKGQAETTLSLNAIRWACGDASAAVGLASDFNHFEDELTADGHTVSQSVSPAALAGLDCFVCEFNNSYTDAENDALEAFVTAGGGLVLGGHSWYWSYSNTDVAHNYPGNKLLDTTGLFVSTSTTTASATLGSTPPARLYRTVPAVDALKKHLSEENVLTTQEEAEVSSILTHAVEELPLDYENVWPALKTLVNGVGWTQISESEPFDLRGDSIEKLFLKIQEQILLRLPASELPAHPSASSFPGAVTPAAARVTQTLSIDGDFKGLPKNFNAANPRSDGRRTTGLYAPPGEVVTVTFPQSITGTGVNVLIGAQSDKLWNKDSVKRHPVIIRAWDVDSTTLQVANAFGGTLYIRIPAGSTLGDFDVTIANAVKAPHYIHGETTLAQWRNTVRHHPAPWAELESDLFIITIPSNKIRDLDDPSATMDFWDKALQMEHDLSGYAPWPRVERVTYDVQISAGYMHSGYPFMAPINSLNGSPVLDATELYKVGNWGYFHELGHNHQWNKSTLPGNRETSCNFYSAKLMTTLVGIPLSQGHSSQTETTREARARGYINNGTPITDWNVWTALETHLQVQGAFGWAAITKAQKAYYTMSNPPSGDAAEFNRWVVELSIATGYNLAPFHQAWGFDLTDATRTAVSHLPTWNVGPLDRWDADPVSCGSHTALSCSECPWNPQNVWKGAARCNGDCEWTHDEECVWGG